MDLERGQYVVQNFFQPLTSQTDEFQKAETLEHQAASFSGNALLHSGNDTCALCAVDCSLFSFSDESVAHKIRFVGFI